MIRIVGERIVQIFYYSEMMLDYSSINGTKKKEGLILHAMKMVEKRLEEALLRRMVDSTLIFLKTSISTSVGYAPK
jgi:hypothetical protein